MICYRMCPKTRYEMATLAEREGTEAQTLAEHNAVYSPRYGGYFVELKSAGTRALGRIAPSGRQEVSRWIAGAGAGPPQYLQKAASDESSQLVLALDMRDMLEPANADPLCRR